MAIQYHSIMPRNPPLFNIKWAVSDEFEWLVASEICRETSRIYIIAGGPGQLVR